ncbi:hypothetical protein MSG28_000998 [Choristoneura fumiferana]|uniref:Uncharacterized protein n=1 Tax=Choristoneura fumiferana TaxID=7141 RepID=A0ACC0K3V7_CHOFU|nr:hypothetical protein MSG28_000998 [Choristoneura fumiferana]
MRLGPSLLCGGAFDVDKLLWECKQMAHNRDNPAEPASALCRAVVLCEVKCEPVAVIQEQVLPRRRAARPRTSELLSQCQPKWFPHRGECTPKDMTKLNTKIAS